MSSGKTDPEESNQERVSVGKMDVKENNQNGEHNQKGQYTAKMVAKESSREEESFGEMDTDKCDMKGVDRHEHRHHDLQQNTTTIMGGL